MSVLPTTLEEPIALKESVRGRRYWQSKFAHAFRGLKRGIRGNSSFFVHFFFAALVCVTAFVLRCTAVEWSILILCIGFVLTVELLNSAAETFFRGLDKDIRDRMYPCLDIMAGAVLMACLAAGIVGAIVFLNRLFDVPA